MTPTVVDAVLAPEDCDASLVTQGLKARLARGAALALVLQVLGAGLAYLLQIALARWMGIARFGTYAYVIAWTTILALLAGLGFPSSVLRFVPHYRAVGDHDRLRGLLRVSRGATLVAGFILAVSGTIVLVVFASDLGQSGSAALIAMWLIPAGALINLDSAIIRAGGRVFGAYAPSLIARPLGILLIAFVVWHAGGRLTVLEGIVISLGSFGAVALVQVKFVRDMVKSGGSLRHAVSYEPRLWLRASTPLLLVAGFQIVLGQADLLIIGGMRGARGAALYLAAAKTAMLVSYLLVAVSAVTAPLFAELHVRGDRAGLQRLATTSAQWVFWPTLLLTTALTILAPYVLGLFGPEFIRARWALQILLLGQLVNAACGSVGYLLSMTGHQDEIARVYGITAAFNVALCYVGARAFGLTGAACATTVSMITWNVWLHRLTRRRLGVRASFLSSLTLRRARRA